MLETARKHSPSNPQIHLLLIKLYSYLGAMDFCTELYNNLSIKHIQIDTLGSVGVVKKGCDYWRGCGYLGF